MDISCGCFSGSVAAFDGLRCAWSEAAGYGVVNYGFGAPLLMPNIPIDRYSEEDMRGEWPDGAPDDPLIILLVHEEEEGRIKNEHCSYLADRLEELEAVFMRQHQPSTVILMTQQFARGLRYAVSQRQDVVFS